MIFVTVGSTYFDELIETVDSLAAAGFFSDESVVCQIGRGNYVPSNVEHFRYARSLDQYFDRSKLVITHGGATVLELYRRGLPLIAVPNPHVADNHQALFLNDIKNELGICVADNVQMLADSYVRMQGVSKRSTGRKDGGPQSLFDYLSSL